MNENKKARIINECLEAVFQNRQSMKDCLERYPELKIDLLDVFSVFHTMQNFQAPQPTPYQTRQMRNQLMFKLSDRDEIVTKSPQFRYKWQNIKRRLGMTWVIIVTTFLSLISGGGVVYASNSALPGDMLYPVKTWAEDLQLTLLPDAIDIKLLENFADHRIEELAALVEAGELDRIGGLIKNYQNQSELMTALMERIEAENPDEAVRLRTELNNQLQNHARVLEGYIKKDGENNSLQERLRVMLQTNTQTQLRINEKPVIVEPVEPSEVTPEITETPAVLPESETKYQNQNQNRVVDLPNEYLQDGVLKFQFRFDWDLAGGVYAEVAGAQYECLVDGNLVTCDLTGVPVIGKLSLFQRDSKLLLYSYDYDHNYNYLWEGTKESGGSQEQGNPDSGNGSPENGKNGMK